MDWAHVEGKTRVCYELYAWQDFVIRLSLKKYSSNVQSGCPLFSAGLVLLKVPFDKHSEQNVLSFSHFCLLIIFDCFWLHPLKNCSFAKKIYIQFYLYMYNKCKYYKILMT